MLPYVYISPAGSSKPGKEQRVQYHKENSMKKKHMIRTLLSAVITAALVLTMPAAALADESGFYTAAQDQEGAVSVQENDITVPEQENGITAPEQDDDIAMPEQDDAGTGSGGENNDPEPEWESEDVLPEEIPSENELLGVAKYDLWIGDTRVTSLNCDDLSDAVIGAGATASFDPETYTLTMHNVKGINGYYEQYGEKYLIFNRGYATLNFRGDIEISGYDTDTTVIWAPDGLDIEGDVSMSGDGDGIGSNYGITVGGEDTKLTITSYDSEATMINARQYVQNAGNVELKGLGDGVSAQYVYIYGGSLDADVSGTASLALWFNEMMLGEDMAVTVPADHHIVPSYARQTIADQFDNVAQKVRIERAYDLWIGNTRVSESNYSDLSDAVTGAADRKAYFDPKTNTLTLHKVTGIVGVNTDGLGKYLIRDGLNAPLKLRGDAVINDTDPDITIIDASYILDIEGNFKLTGKGDHVIWGTGLTVGGKDTVLEVITEKASGVAIVAGWSGYSQTGGSVDLKGGYAGLRSYYILSLSGGKLHALSTGSNSYAVRFREGPELGSGMQVTVPGDHTIGEDVDDYFIAYGNGSPATEVTIEKAYDLWVGSKRVTEEICSNLPVYGGSAFFDPETNTLYLNYVDDVVGSYQGRLPGSSRALIYSKIPLNIRGIADLGTPGSDQIPIVMDDADLNIEGDFDLKGGRAGAITTLDGGSITIGDSLTNINAEVSGDNAVAISAQDGIIVNAGDVFADGGTGEGSIGMQTVTGNIEFNGGAVKAKGSVYAVLSLGSHIAVDDDMTFVTPADGSVISHFDPVHPDYVTIADGEGNIAKEAKIEMKSAVPFYKVEFNLNGKPGSAPLTQKVKRGMKASEPAMPKAPAGYHFNGWYRTSACTDRFDFDTAITSNVVLYAGWREDDAFTVSFDANGKNAANMPKNKTVAEGGSVSEPSEVPKAAGFKFSGWFIDSACTVEYNFSAAVYTDTVLYAKWIKESAGTVKLTFMMCGYGTKIPAQIVEKGKKPIQPADPADTDMFFVGWFESMLVGAPRFDFTKPMDSSKTAYARWAPNEKGFSVYFDLTGSSLTYNSGMGRYEHVYTGDKITPKITVRKNSNDMVLTEGVDYTVKYSNNINVDRKGKPAVVTVTGKGSYSGSRTLPFYVIPKSLGDGKTGLPAHQISIATLLAVPGAKVSPVICYNGNKLSAKDYRLTSRTGRLKFTVDDPIEDRVITVTGVGNYSGSIIVDVILNYKEDYLKKEIKVSLQNVGSFTYDGSPKTLDASQLIVKNMNNELVPETGYTVVYSNNVNAGTAKVIVTGRGGYNGIEVKTFKIAPDKKDSVITVKPNTDAVRFAGAFAGPSVMVKASRGGVSTTLKQNVDYKLTYSGNKKVTDTAKYRVTFIGNYAGHRAVSGTYKVLPAILTVASLKLTAPDLEYTKPGKYLSEPYVTFNGTLLKKSDYTLRYEVDGEDITTNKKYEISGDEVPVTILVSGKGNYAGSETAVPFYNTYRIKKTPAGAYDLSKAKITMKGDMKKGIPGQTFTGEAITPDFDIFIQDGNDWKSVNALGLVKDTDYKIFYFNNTGKGSATILVKGISDKAVKSKTATFQIGALSFLKILQRIKL